jgi:hypothetical protein
MMMIEAVSNSQRNVLADTCILFHSILFRKLSSTSIKVLDTVPLSLDLQPMGVDVEYSFNKNPNAAHIKVSSLLVTDAGYPTTVLYPDE